jgi:hypothetical protein
MSDQPAAAETTAAATAQPTAAAATTGQPSTAPASGTAAAPVLVIDPRPQANAPLRKLTTGLLATYKLINTRYYEAKKARLKGGKEDYTAVVGEVLGGLYRVEETMGKGSFGQVVSATHIKSGVKVAVKVIKNKDAFRRQARTEIKLLEMLNRKDPDDQWCIGTCPPLPSPLYFRLLSPPFALPPSPAPRSSSLPVSHMPLLTPCCLLQYASWTSLTTAATHVSCLSTCRLTYTSY